MRTNDTLGLLLHCLGFLLLWLRILFVLVVAAIRSCTTIRTASQTGRGRPRSSRSLPRSRLLALVFIRLRALIPALPAAKCLKTGFYYKSASTPDQALKRFRVYCLRGSLG